jgi:hypothetical protein
MRSHVFVINLNKNQSKVGKDKKMPLLRCRSLDDYHVPITAAVDYQLPITSDYTTVSFRGDKKIKKIKKIKKYYGKIEKMMRNLIMTYPLLLSIITITI